MTKWRSFCLFFICLPTISAFALSTPTSADEPDRSSLDRVRSNQTMTRTVTRAISYLRVKGQSDDGSYSGFVGIGPTALVTIALLQHGQPPESPHVAKSLRYLESFVQDDGGIYQTGTTYRNYETCLAIICFQESGLTEHYAKTIKRADAFVKGLQWDEGEGKDPSDTEYGGGGYGEHKRPDLSNTSYLIDALKAAGNDADSEAIQRALVFVSRCQNLESSHNTTPFSAKINDGGFYYTPAAGGSSKADTTPNGGLRSYGSMTYAGLKSMLYAGVGPDDPRVKGAVKWIGKHYDLTSNPGMGSAGLYYYYHTFAKALDAIGADQFVDEQGTIHDWRAELVSELARRQQPDGSWVNDTERWFEGDANLSTGYALLALSFCRPPANEPSKRPKPVGE